MNSPPVPVLPDYPSGSIRSLVPDLVARRGAPPWLAGAPGGGPVVLLVIDGLGWEQFQAHREQMPTLGGFSGGPITSVVPSTTAAALTSISTGLTPGEHGIISYRMLLGGDVVNTLRWTSQRGDMRNEFPPNEVQPFAPFLGEDVAVCTRAAFSGTGFTIAHLRGAREMGWSQPSNLAVEVRRALAAGHRLVYAYYDAVDHVAHEFGFGEHYEAELRMADHVVAEVLNAVPSGTTVVVSADHGQVEVGERVIGEHADVRRLTRLLSGEGRFRWIHARPGAAEDLLVAASEAYGALAWVRSRQQCIDDGWFGPVVSPPVAARVGDVAVAAHAPVSFDDPAEHTSIALVCRHGSLTSAEMLVPRLVQTA